MAQLWAEKGLETTVNNGLHAPMFIGTLNDDVLLIIFDFCRTAAEGPKTFPPTRTETGS